MSYYAPFIQPQTYYQPTQQNAFLGQNYGNNGYPTQTQGDSSMIVVLGRNEAEGYPVAPNCTVTLWDKNNPVIYLKSMSADRVPRMRILDYTERAETPQTSSVTAFQQETVNYATKSEIEEINGKISELTARFETLSAKAEESKEKPTTKKKASEE